MNFSWFSAVSICVLSPGGALRPGGAVDHRLPGRKYKLHLLHIQPRGAAQQVEAKSSRCFCFVYLFLWTVLCATHLPCCQLAYKIKNELPLHDNIQIIGFNCEWETTIHVLVSTQTSMPGLFYISSLIYQYKIEVVRFYLYFRVLSLDEWIHWVLLLLATVFLPCIRKSSKITWSDKLYQCQFYV